MQTISKRNGLFFFVIQGIPVTVRWGKLSHSSCCALLAVMRLQQVGKWAGVMCWVSPIAERRCLTAAGPFECRQRVGTWPRFLWFGFIRKFRTNYHRRDLRQTEELLLCRIWYKCWFFFFVVLSQSWHKEALIFWVMLECSVVCGCLKHVCSYMNCSVWVVS